MAFAFPVLCNDVTLSSPLLLVRAELATTAVRQTITVLFATPESITLRVVLLDNGGRKRVSISREP